MRSATTIAITLLVVACVSFTAISCRTKLPAGAGLYQDSQVKAILEKYRPYGKHYDPGDPSFLDIVPNGKSKKLKLIFEQLGLDPRRLEKPQVGQLDMVKFHRWQVSPRFVLSIMVATNDPKNDFSDLWKLNGYGVRIYEEQPERK